jgi:hypothetical protein
MANIFQTPWEWGETDDGQGREQRKTVLEALGGFPRQQREYE